MLTPLVSVVIPSYNRADLVGETIESVLSQDYPHLEVIVLDDGSTDDTESVLRTFGDKITWHRHDNMGETQTVNRGFSMAQGEIVTVLSSDDLFLPGAVSTAVQLLSDRPEVVATYCDWIWIDGAGRVLQLHRCPEHDLVEVVRHSECLPGPGAFFRRQVLDQVQGRDPQFRYVADFDFWLRVALLGPVVRIPRFQSAFREHGTSISVAGLNLTLAHELTGVIENFYQRPDLGPEIQRIRPQAMAAAHFTAGCRCGDNFRFKLGQFVKAFPHISNYRRGRAILELMQGFAWARALKQFLIQRIRQSSGVGKHYSEVLPTLQATDSAPA